jgi:predicted nucleotidyltransferase
MAMTKRRTTDPTVKHFLAMTMDTIRREFAPQHVIVIGSRAKGTAHVQSDIDLIVVSERFQDIRYPNRMGQFLIKVRPDVAVDAICYTPQEFEAVLQHQSPFVREAMAHGIHII